MSWHGWLVTGIGVGMLLERALVWAERKCASYLLKRKARRELAEFWSER